MNYSKVILKYNAFFLVNKVFNKPKILATSYNSIEVQDNYLSEFKELHGDLITKFQSKKRTIKNYCYIQLCYDQIVSKYMIENKYGDIHYVNNNNSLFTFDTIEVINSDIKKKYVNNIYCHCTEIYILIERLKTEQKKIKDIYNKYKTLLRSHINKKINDIDRLLFTRYIHNSPAIYYSMLNVYKLELVLEAKMLNIYITGKSDLMNVKKYINIILENIINKIDVEKYLYYINLFQNKYKTDYGNTILEKRVDDIYNKLEYGHIVDKIVDIKLNNKIYIISNTDIIRKHSKEIKRIVSLLFKQKTNTVEDKISNCIKTIIERNSNNVSFTIKLYIHMFNNRKIKDLKYHDLLFLQKSFLLILKNLQTKTINTLL